VQFAVHFKQMIAS